MNQDWINVEVELPAEKQMVWFLVNYNPYFGQHFGYYYEGQFYGFNGTGYTPVTEGTVIKWKPSE
jgi:hypothetical protein